MKAVCASVLLYVYSYSPSALRQKADVGNVLKDSLVDNQPAISEVCGSGAAGLWRITLLNLSRWQVAAFLLVEGVLHTYKWIHAILEHLPPKLCLSEVS